MSVENLKALLPEYVEDLKLNPGSIGTEAAAIVSGVAQAITTAQTLAAVGRS